MAIEVLSIRQFTAADASPVRDLICRLKGTTVPLDYVRSLLANPTNYLFAAYAGESIAGFAYAHKLNRLAAADHIFIYEIEVAEAHRRKGVGRVLIERIRQIDPAAECFVLTDHSNAPAMSFYQATGGTIEQADAVLFVYGPKGQ